MIIIGDERLHTEFLGYRDKCREPIEVRLREGTHARLHIAEKQISKSSNMDGLRRWCTR